MTLEMSTVEHDEEMRPCKIDESEPVVHSQILFTVETGKTIAEHCQTVGFSEVKESEPVLHSNGKSKVKKDETEFRGSVSESEAEESETVDDLENETHIRMILMKVKILMKMAHHTNQKDDRENWSKKGINMVQVEVSTHRIQVGLGKMTRAMVSLFFIQKTVNLNLAVQSVGAKHKKVKPLMTRRMIVHIRMILMKVKILLKNAHHTNQKDDRENWTE